MKSCFRALLWVGACLATAAQGAFNGREIVRAPDMCNVDIVDTVSWFAEESVRLSVEPWRCGKRVEIPEGATAAWVVCDEGGTNWIVRYDAAPASNRCAFALGAGEGALPSGHDYTGYVSLLRGTNILGVLDRHEVRVMGQAADGGSELSPDGGAWGSLLQRMAEAEADIAGIAGDLAHQAQDLAAVEELASGFAGNINALEGATNALDAAVADNAADLAAHVAATNNPHGVTLRQAWGADADDAHDFATDFLGLAFNDGKIMRLFGDRGRGIEFYEGTIYGGFDFDTRPSVEGVGLATTNDVAPVEARVEALEGATNALDAAVGAVDGRIDGLWAECTGGFRWPDYFTARAVPGRWGAWRESPVARSTNNSLVVATATNTAIRGWELEAEVIRQADFGAEVEWESDAPEIAVERDAGTWFADFTDGFDPETQEGDAFAVTGRLGGRESTLLLAATNLQRQARRQFDGAAPGSVLAEAIATVEDAANAAPEGAVMRTWTGTVSAPATWDLDWDCWLLGGPYDLESYGLPVSLAMQSADGTWTRYRPLTMVSPRHAVAAKHWCPPKGSTNLWMYYAGHVEPGVVDDWVDIRDDLRLVRIEWPPNMYGPLPAFCLPDNWEQYFIGAYGGGVGGIPGVPVLSLNATEQARVAWWKPAPLMRGEREKGPSVRYRLAGDLGRTDGRFEAPAVPGVGGDSGSPAFLVVRYGDGEGRLVLVGCFWHGTDGPLPTAGELNRAIADAWPSDSERVEAADFGAWGYTNYRDGDLTPW